MFPVILNSKSAWCYFLGLLAQHNSLLSYLALVIRRFCHFIIWTMEEPRWPAASSRYWQAFNCTGSHWFALWVQTRVPVGLRSSAPALFCWPLQFCWLRQTQECLWTSNWAHRSLSFSTIKQNTDTDTKTHTHTHTYTHTPTVSKWHGWWSN